MAAEEEIEISEDYVRKLKRTLDDYAKRLAELEKGAPLIQQILRWITSFRVTGAQSFQNTPYGATLTIGQPAKDYRRPRNDGSVWIKITAAAQDEDFFRWTYTARFVVEPTTAFGTWEEASGAVDVPAYNTLEHANTATDPGVQSGIAIDSITPSEVTGISPAHTGAIVRAWPSTRDGEPCYDFTFQNQPIVGCNSA